MQRLFTIASLMLLSALSLHAATPVIWHFPNNSYLSEAYLDSHPSQPITIRGANLAGTTLVKVGGVPVEALKVVDDNTVTCSVPKPKPYVPYTYKDLFLQTPGGTVTLSNAILLVGKGAGITAVGRDWAVLVEAVVSADPSPSITLKWPLETRATTYEISRKSPSAATWAVVGTADGKSTSWQDVNVAAGQLYEYRVKRASTIMALVDGFTPSIVTGLTSYGYIYSGIALPPADHRGTVILIVDKTMAGPCAAELVTLQNDLIGDGWSVIRHDVARGGDNDPSGAPAVKQLIQADYLKDPHEVKAVYLFGHVPVPYSGDFVPTAHANEHKGAFPADVYYGDMDGVWTDTVVNDKTAISPRTSCWNVPGDGKFDQSWAPSEVELQVGRVDLWGMEGWGVSEVDQLKNYITKSHKHRQALKVLPRRALIQAGISADGHPQSYWRSWSPLVGPGNVDSGEFQTSLIANNEEYLGFAVVGGGDNDRTNDVYSNDFYKSDPKAAFYMTFGSHHGDWDQRRNLLRAPLGTATCGLTNMYGFYPSAYLHSLGVGGTFGEAIRLRQNNTTTYEQYDAQNSGGVHIALMGDPTLRLFAVMPPSALSLSKDGGNHPVLSWQASSDAALLGYYVYRAADAAGPFARITNLPLTTTTFTDTSVNSGTYAYQVKAAKLETTASGTYINTSQAITGAITAAAIAAGVLEFQSPIYAHGERAASPRQITVVRRGGAAGAVSVKYATVAGGSATPGADYANASGTLTWASGDSSAKTFAVSVAPDAAAECLETISLALSSPTGGATLGTSAALLTIAEDGAGTIFQAEPVAIKAGKNGTSKMTITCIRTGGATGRVDLHYATCVPARGVSNYPHRNALGWGVDYDSAEGTLTWLDGDTAPKTFDIVVHGSTGKPGNSFFPIHYTITAGSATVKHPESFHNYILND